MVAENPLPDLREIGLPYRIAFAVFEMQKFKNGIKNGADNLFIVGEWLHALSQDDERISDERYTFLREPLERVYKQRYGREIKNVSDLKRSLEKISKDFIGFGKLSKEDKDRLQRFSLILYNRIMYYQRMEWLTPKQN